MVSLAAKVSMTAATCLSGPTDFPRSIRTTLKGGGGGAGGGACTTGGGGGGGGGGGLLQPKTATALARSPRAKAPRRRDMGTSSFLWGQRESQKDVSWPESSAPARGE